MTPGNESPKILQKQMITSAYNQKHQNYDNEGIFSSFMTLKHDFRNKLV